LFQTFPKAEVTDVPLFGLKIEFKVTGSQTPEKIAPMFLCFVTVYKSAFKFLDYNLKHRTSGGFAASLVKTPRIHWTACCCC